MKNVHTNARNTYKTILLFTKNENKRLRHLNKHIYTSVIFNIKYTNVCDKKNKEYKY